MLYDYQTQVVEFMIETQRCGIFLDMGLGKTLCTLQYLYILKTVEEVNRVLVVAPVSVINNVWPEQNLRWKFNFDMVRVVGDPAKRKKLIRADHFIYLISPDTLGWLVKEKLHTGFDIVVVDEYSMFKNPRSIRFKSLKKIPSTRFIGLTGTPITNNIYDIWGLMYYIDKGERLYNTKGAFQDEWFRPGMSKGYVVYNWRPKPFAEKNILDKIRDVTISMKNEDYIQLPNIITIPYFVELDGKGTRAYETLKRDFILEFKDEVVDASTAAILVGKLQQIANGHVYVDTTYGSYEHIHDCKLDAVKDLIQGADDNILLVNEYQHDKRRILNTIEESYILDVQRWNNREFPVMVMSSKEGGYGLNLQDGGSIIVWYSPIWNMELYQQTIARIHRQGQTKPVRNYVILAKNTIDEKIWRVLQGKKKNLDIVMEALKLELK